MKLTECIADSEVYFVGKAVRYILLLSIFNRLRTDQFNYLEIGVWLGANIKALSEVVPQDSRVTIDACDPHRPFNKKLDVDRSSKSRKIERLLLEDLASNLFIENVRQFIDQGVVRYIRLTSTEFYKINLTKYDMVYIDGSHYYEDVITDLDGIYKSLKDNWILVLDDCEAMPWEVSETELHMEDDYAYSTNAKKWFHPGVTRAINDHFGRNEISTKTIQLAGLLLVFPSATQCEKFKRIPLDIKIPSELPPEWVSLAIEDLTSETNSSPGHRVKDNRILFDKRT